MIIYHSYPLAAGTNRVKECLRDIGLEAECVELGSEGDALMHTRWCYSMAGEEYARIYSWGNNPKRKVLLPKNAERKLRKKEGTDC